MYTSRSPAGVAVDSFNDHVYWVSNYDNKLYRCKLDGTNVVVFNTLSYTFMIQLDVTNRYLIFIYLLFCLMFISARGFKSTVLKDCLSFVSMTVAIDCEIIAFPLKTFRPLFVRHAFTTFSVCCIM